MSSSPVQHPPPSGEEASIKFISLKEMAKKIACITSDPNIENEEDKISKIASLLNCQCMTWPNQTSEKSSVYRNLPFSVERALRTAEKLLFSESEDDVHTAIREEIIKGYQMGNGTDENTYNSIVGGVGYVCLFLMISTDSFSNYWGKSSLLCAFISLGLYVFVPILRMLKAAKCPKWLMQLFEKIDLERKIWPWSFGISFFCGLFAWILTIFSRFIQ